MLKLVGNNVAIKRDTKEAQTAGGIFIPEQAQEKSPEATVVAVGPDAALRGIEQGQTVIVAPYSGMDFESAEGKLIIIDASDILAIKEG